MSLDSEIHVGDGTKLSMTVMDSGSVVDLSTSTAKSIVIKKPDGTSTSYTATFETDGTDGIVYYNCATSDLDIHGIYQIQAHIVFGSRTFRSTIESFRVFCNL